MGVAIRAAPIYHGADPARVCDSKSSFAIIRKLGAIVRQYGADGVSLSKNRARMRRCQPSNGRIKARLVVHCEKWGLWARFLR